MVDNKGRHVAKLEKWVDKFGYILFSVVFKGTVPDGRLDITISYYLYPCQLAMGASYKSFTAVLPPESSYMNGDHCREPILWAKFFK
jgi:hypothetical protein